MDETLEQSVGVSLVFFLGCCCCSAVRVVVSSFGGVLCLVTVTGQHERLTRSLWMDKKFTSSMNFLTNPFNNRHDWARVSSATYMDLVLSARNDEPTDHEKADVFLSQGSRRRQKRAVATVATVAPNNTRMHHHHHHSQHQQPATEASS